MAKQSLKDKFNLSSDKVDIKEGNFPLTKINFLLMLVCGVIILVGFLLMLGEPSGEEFNPDIFSTRRIVVGPTMAFVGFVLMGFAIIYSPRKKNKEENNNEEK